MNAILQELSPYVLLKQNWDAIQLKMEVRNQLEAIQTLTKSFEKGVFEDGSKNKLSVITPDIFNERIMCYVIEHVLCKFDVPISQDTTCTLLKELVKIPKSVVRGVLQMSLTSARWDHYDPESIRRDYHREMTTSPPRSCGLLVRRNAMRTTARKLRIGNRITITPVNLTTFQTMELHESTIVRDMKLKGPLVLNFMSSSTLLQQLKHWYSFLEVEHGWDACKFQIDIEKQAVVDDCLQHFSVYERRIEVNVNDLLVDGICLHDYLRYAFVVQGKLFLLIDVSKLEVRSFVIPLDGKKLYWDRFAGNIRSTTHVQNVWSPNFASEYDEYKGIYAEHELEKYYAITNEEAVILHKNLVQRFTELFDNMYNASRSSSIISFVASTIPSPSPILSGSLKVANFPPLSLCARNTAAMTQTSCKECYSSDDDD